MSDARADAVSRPGTGAEPALHLRAVVLPDGVTRDVFVARVGYDPIAYVTLLNRLCALKGDEKAFFKTHPNFSNRINAVQEVIQTHGWKPTGVLLEDRFARLRGKV